MPNAPVIVVNPTAGNGRAGRLLPWLRRLLEHRSDARLLVTRRAGDAEEMAARAIEDGHDRAIAVGGDGTVQEVVNGLRANGHRGELAILPVGTGNDLARSLGLPRDAGTAWRVAMGRAVRSIDVGEAVGVSGARRSFVSAGGIGFDAEVAASMADRRGWQASRAGYLLSTLNQLRHFENRRVRVTLDGETVERQVLFVAFANGAYYGGGMRIAPDARPDDGVFDVCVVGNVSRMTALRELPNIYRGAHVHNPAVEMRRARTIGFDGDRRTRVHLDGEPFGTLPITISLVPGALTVAAVR